MPDDGIRASAIWFVLVRRLLSRDWSIKEALLDGIYSAEECSDNFFAAFYANPFRGCRANLMCDSPEF